MCFAESATGPLPEKRQSGRGGAGWTEGEEVARDNPEQKSHGETSHTAIVSGKSHKGWAQNRRGSQD